MLAQVKAPLWADSGAFQEYAPGLEKNRASLFYQVFSSPSSAFERRRVDLPPSCYLLFLYRGRPGRALQITSADQAKAAAVLGPVPAMPAAIHHPPYARPPQRPSIRPYHLPPCSGKLSRAR